MPQQPPPGLSGERPQASSVPGGVVSTQRSSWVSMTLLPQGQRARPWLWAGHGVAMRYVLLALIARWANLA